MPEFRSIAWRPAAVTTAVAVAPLLLLIAIVLLLGGAGPSTAGIWAGRLWLFGVGGGLTIAGLHLPSIPLGGFLLAGLCALGAARATVSTAKVPDEPIVFAAVCGGFAAVFAAVLSVATSIGPGGTSMVRSAFGAFAVVFLGIGIDLVHRSGHAPWSGPSRIAGLIRAAFLGFWIVIASAFVLFMLLLLNDLDTAGNLWASLNPDGGGAAALIALVFVTAPTYVAWTASVLLGPGFALGAQSHIDLTGIDVGPLPLFPPLAALPEPGPFNSAVVLLALIPVLAGVVVGWRSHRDDSRIADALVDGLGAGALAGGALGVVLMLSVGPVGPGSLATAGPSLVTPMLVAVLTLGAGGALGALGAHYRVARVAHS